MAPLLKGSRLYRIGIVILILGLAAAEGIYLVGERSSTERKANQESGEVNSTIPYDKLKGADQNIERTFGKNFVLLIYVERWWSALPGHQQLALIVAAVTILISLGCVLFAK
jgi:hypothetical protein